MLRWFGQALAVCGVIGVACAPYLVAWALHDEASQGGTLLGGGLTVQLLGFLLAWRQISAALRQYGRPSLLKRPGLWWRARPRRDRVLRVGAASILVTGGEVNLRVGRGRGDYSPHARILALETNLKSLEHDFDSFRVAQKRELLELREQLKAQGEQHQQATQELAVRVASTAVGSADMQTIGLTWFVAGSIASTLAPWFASF